ncbi:MAG: DUF1385 domain-containing protein [Clostridia bacterium]|nr:DUF1385 domain-containing protein [Clostridia bacterium]MBQ6234018.1 DUF1385 domain-containing protein [Clostridia bacterium]
MSVENKPVDIGGQAVLEGVMMKGPEAIAIAVRRENGDIIVSRETYEPLSKKHPWMGKPFIRGAVSFITMLSQGMKTLEKSSQMLGVVDEEPTKFEKWLAEKLGKGVDKVVMGVAMVFAVVLSLGLFVLLPNIPTRLLTEAGWSPLAVNLLSGVIRTVLLIGYIWGVGKVPDMRRTFQYHGSEHKTVYCHEAGLPLTPENAQKFSTLHPRCGTSFLLITFILSILLYTTIDYIILAVTGFNLSSNYIIKVVSRLLLLPLVTGVSYEALKGLAHSETKVCRMLRWPGMQLQRLTTKPPTDEMCEVAIASMNAALNGLPEGEKTPEGWVILPKAV